MCGQYVFLDFSIPPKNHVVSNYEINVKLMNQYAFLSEWPLGHPLLSRVRHLAASSVNKSVIFETYNLLSSKSFVASA